MTISFDEMEHGTWNGPTWCSAHVTSEGYLYLVKLGETSETEETTNNSVFRYERFLDDSESISGCTGFFFFFGNTH